MRASPLLVLGLTLLLGACTSTAPLTESGMALIDPDATEKTKALYANLKRIAPEAILFGHQDALAYGVNWWREADRSDVKDVTGAYPAVYGWELGDLEIGAAQNLDRVRFDDMQHWIKLGYERGGVVTISWHMNNPVSGGNAWDTTPAVEAILPGGTHHAWYRQALDRFADFVDGLRVGPLAWLGAGDPVPIIFRPFHEHTGSWFWWGKGHTTPEAYKQLWRFTVEYLRDEKDLHNLIYAYSTDRFGSKEQYLEHYPGDAYVDLLGFDDYHGPSSRRTLPGLTERLCMLVEMAEARGKLAALTETGSEGVKMPTWWTERLLRAITADPMARRISYVMLWRNANVRDKPGHHYAPYAGHTSAADFIRFYQNPFVHFGDTLPDLYTSPNPSPP